MDLGDCFYEPGSDGKVISVLTNPEVVTTETKPNWTARSCSTLEGFVSSHSLVSIRSLLQDIASANPPVHALIDTGALITGMDNFAVAQFLLEHLPEFQFDGVVFLDNEDRYDCRLFPPPAHHLFQPNDSASRGEWASSAVVPSRPPSRTKIYVL